jgi:hypothetical protein
MVNGAMIQSGPNAERRTPETRSAIGGKHGVFTDRNAPILSFPFPPDLRRRCKDDVSFRTCALGYLQCTKGEVNFDCCKLLPIGLSHSKFFYQRAMLPQAVIRGSIFTLLYQADVLMFNVLVSLLSRSFSWRLRGKCRL